jgi:hypothetical protein
MKFKGNFGELTLNINGTEATGTYQENGTLKGTFINNTFKGQWKNKGMEGLVDFKIKDNKLEGNWKKGLDTGPMKGKWEGSLFNMSNKKFEENEKDKTITKLENEINEIENSLVKITISGRISNYLFGIVRPEYFDECEKALQFTSNEVQEMGDFMTLLYETTLESGFESGLDIFHDNMNMEDFKDNCPLLSEFLESVKAGHASYYQFYDTILEHSDEDINIIEDDAFITIYVNEEEVVAEQKLSDFLGEINWVDEDDDPKAIATANAIWNKQINRFNIDESTWIGKSENGTLIIDEWLKPFGLEKFKSRVQNVTIEHDNIVDFEYYIETKDFNFEKLAFLKYSNMADFHDSGAEYIGSYLIYENELISPEMKIHRDKGFTLYYEPEYKSCSSLIDG